MRRCRLFGHRWWQPEGIFTRAECRRCGAARVRHAFCTLSHDAGVTTRNIQHSGGWSDERMAAYYDHGGASLAAHATHSLSAFVAGVG